MAQRALEQRVENLEHRVATVEQILPTLATKTDLAELRIATKADLQAAIAPLATKADMKAEAEQTRRHFDVVAEGLRAEIRLIADGHAATQASDKATRTDLERVRDQHDRRLMHLEASQKRR
ncbi:MAG: hypothetical protein ABMA15_27805 [Vicinamibacterales bacterium]